MAFGQQQAGITACARLIGRAAVGRLCAALVLFVAMCLSAVSSAQASKYASIAYDANTGKVLFGTNENEARYPASLTKIMTLYIVFDLIEQGRLSYNTKIRFSAQAAAQPPSKIGLDVGESIRLIDAIKALVTKSANDVAVAVAEHIAGSEAAFARVMTSRARKLGMNNTTFHNASGLPDSRQMTTARDMIRLGLRIQEDFPERYKLFKTKYFKYRGKTYKNHNALLGSFPGVDGIKTGYIRASGFNLVSSVKRDGKHVIAAVFGGKTGRKRNALMRSLLSRALKKASPTKTRKPLLIAKPRPVMRPKLPVQKPDQGPVLDQRIEVGRAAEPRPAVRPRAKLKPSIAIARVRPGDVTQRAATGNADVAAAPADGGLWRDSGNATAQNAAEPARERGTGRAPGTLQDQLAALLARSSLAQAALIPSPEAQEGGEEQGSTDQDAEPNYAAGHPAAAAAAPSGGLAGGMAIQVGAYTSHGEAEARLAQVARLGDRLLDGFTPEVPSFERGATRFYRARFAGFDPATAKAACSELERRGVDCFVVRR